MSACIDGLVDLDRRWTYVDYYEDPSIPEYHTLTEAEILREYWPYWSERMQELGRRPNPLDCVMDWVIANWADLA